MVLKNKKIFGKNELFFAVLSVMCIVGMVWLEMTMPGYMTKISAELKAVSPSFSRIANYGLLMLLCALGSFAFSIIVGFSSARLSASVTRTLREKIYDKVASLGVAEVKRFSTASLITRTTNDVRQVAMIIAFGLQVSFRAPITAVWAIAKISGSNWQWTLATVIAVVIMLASFLFVTLFVVPRFRKIQALTDDVNRVSRENLNGIRVVHAFNAEEYEQEKFEQTNEKLTKINLFVQRVMSAVSPLMSVIMNALSIAIYVIGALLINQAGDLEKFTIFSNLVPFVSYATQAVISFMMLALISFMLPRAIVSIRRINEILKTESSIVGGEFAGETDARGTLELKGVSFKYPDASEYVLKDVSFKIERGETLAIIGSTASGKSTLVNLIPRFYDATSGDILLDGINIKDYSLEALYSKVGYISQKATIISGTIRKNVCLGEVSGKKPDADALENALKISQAKEFVEEREGGDDSDIEQGGTNLSGGQKQRVSIARALARRPEILIFDDSFSALDYKTDKALRASIAANLTDTTCIIVAQRIGTIKDADKIIVLDEGRVVGAGTHTELLNNCAVYREIALSQLSEEELKDGRK